MTGIIFFYEDQKDQHKQKSFDIVESPDLGNFFLASSTNKGRKENLVASSGCFSASEPHTSSSQHQLSFSLKTESVQPNTTNEFENLTPLQKFTAESKTMAKFSTCV